MPVPVPGAEVVAEVVAEAVAVAVGARVVVVVATLHHGEVVLRARACARACACACARVVRRVLQVVERVAAASLQVLFSARLGAGPCLGPDGGPPRRTFVFTAAEG